ncbi:family 43 glycosylhydrolase [bacterium]|nr:family 43 glycosylhydrolase [bacterium]
MKREIKLLVCFILTGITNHAFADYPIVSYRYLADPGALVYNGSVYLYCSNDDENPAGDDSGYEMQSIVCVSSRDLKNWTDHGIVFKVPRDAAWAQFSWAPSAVERNGKFYLYFGNGASGIGVASADSPTGPFTDPIGKPLVSSSTPGVLPAVNMWLFDPMTFIDDDGQAYMYFGGNGEDNLRVIRLNDNMISVDGPATQFHVDYFFEAAWMHKHNGTYYFSYSTNPGNGMRIDYMTSDNPTSDFTYGGIVSPQPPENSNNNHQAIFEFNGAWYEAYHNRYVSRHAGIPPVYKRNLCLDSIYHNPDGSIETMVNTVDGVKQIGNVNPFGHTEAETMNRQNGIETEVCSEGGMNVTSLEDGDWIKVRGVDFGSAGAAAFTASIASDLKVGTSKDGSIEIRIDDINGTRIGIVPVLYTGGLDVWKSETIAIENVTGVHDVYFLFTGEHVDNLFNFDYWQFIQKTSEHDLLAINASVDDSKIDTVAGTNNTNITVTAIYTDGASDVVTSETTFTFDQENIISITDDLVTGVSYGIVTVTASYNDNMDNIKVVVKNLESELAISRLYTDESDVELFIGSSTSIKILAEFDDGHVEDVADKATYDNPSPEIATVSNGVITGMSEGEVDITASYQGELGEAKSTTIHVVVGQGTGVWLEAECGTMGGNWDIVNDAGASNDHYVTVKSGIQSVNQAPSVDDGCILIYFSVISSDSYSVFGRLNCPTYDDDSFWVKMDDGSFQMHNGLVTSGWKWVKFDDYSLTAGEHTLTIGYREDGAKLDKICISNVLESPEGMGEEAVNLCEPTSITNALEIPEAYSLELNYPNPFNPTTRFAYTLPTNSKINISIFNVVGEIVEVLFSGQRDAGKYHTTWDASKYSSGTYLICFTAGDYIQINKCVLLK